MAMARNTVTTTMVAMVATAVMATTIDDQSLTSTP
jgi:hypothetical protein